MKVFKYLLFIFALPYMVSCENPLDSTSLDIINSNVVWKDKSLVEAYFADILNRTDVAYQPTYQENFLWYAATTLSDEGRFRSNAAPYTDANGAVSGTNTNHILEYWRWGLLRDINTAIAELEDSENSIDETYKEMRLGQAYFLRAMVYFNMVKRYGGVPIITEVQDLNLDPEELKVPRSTEKETYDFIASQFDKAIELLKDKSTGKYQPSVDAAYGFKSRAMLYAGSIAQNDAKLPFHKEGLVGINLSEASRYYQLSLEASQALLPAPFGTGSYALRPGATVAQYRQIFDVIDKSNDTETIMYQQFNGQGGIENAADVSLLPRALPEHVGWGANLNVYWETVKWFNYRDGTSGELLPDGSGLLDNNVGPNKFYDLKKLFGTRDPRFGASVAYPGYILKGYPAYFHKSVTNNAAADAAGVPRVAANQNRTRSAICDIKTANTTTPVPVLDLGNNNYMVMRIGEIYLNYAECAFGLGHTVDALAAINAIRLRAGMPELLSLTYDDIKNERKLELSFENHRYWDLKRWRDAEGPLSKQYRGIDWIWNVAEDTYSITLKNAETLTRLFKPQDYYLPIPLDNIQNNDALIQNPGFEL